MYSLFSVLITIHDKSYFFFLLFSIRKIYNFLFMNTAKINELKRIFRKQKCFFENIVDETKSY